MERFGTAIRRTLSGGREPAEDSDESESESAADATPSLVSSMPSPAAGRASPAGVARGRHGVDVGESSPAGGEGLGMGPAASRVPGGDLGCEGTMVPKLPSQPAASPAHGDFATGATPRRAIPRPADRGSACERTATPPHAKVGVQTEFSDTDIKLRKQLFETGQASLETEAKHEEDLINLLHKQRSQGIQAEAEARKVRAISEIEWSARQQELQAAQLFQDQLTAIRSKFQQRRYLLRQQMNDLDMEYYQEKALDTEHMLNMHALHRQYQHGKVQRSRSNTPSPEHTPPVPLAPAIPLCTPGLPVQPRVIAMPPPAAMRAFSPYRPFERASPPGTPIAPALQPTVTSMHQLAPMLPSGYGSTPVRVASPPHAGFTAAQHQSIVSPTVIASPPSTMDQTAKALHSVASPCSSFAPAVHTASFGQPSPVAEVQQSKFFCTNTTTPSSIAPQAFTTTLSTPTVVTPAFMTMSSDASPQIVEAVPSPRPYMQAQVLENSASPQTFLQQPLQYEVVESQPPLAAEEATVMVPDGQGGCWYWVPDDEDEGALHGNCTPRAAMPAGAGTIFSGACPGGAYPYELPTSELPYSTYAGTIH